MPEFLSSFLPAVAGALLSAATLAALADLWSSRGDHRTAIQSLSGAAFLLLAACLAASWGRRDRASTAEILAWVSLGSVAAHLASIAWLKVRSLAPFLLPVAAAAALSAPVAGERPWASPTGTDTPWAAVHGITAVAGFAAFAMAFAAGALYLVQARRIRQDPARALRLPSLETLDRVNLGALLLALPCWTASLLAGILGAQAVWGGDWIRSPLVLLSGATWAVLATVSAVRLASAARGRKVAVLTIAGFLLALTALLGGHR